MANQVLLWCFYFNILTESIQPIFYHLRRLIYSSLISKLSVEKVDKNVEVPKIKCNNTLSSNEKFFNIMNYDE